LERIGKVTFALLLVASLIVGAFLSYLWVMGYYLALGLAIPKRTLIAISDVSLSPQNPTYINVSLINPSFSPKDAKVVGISILTEDGIIHNVDSMEPYIPSEGYTIRVGENETFKCYWSWADHSGETVKVLVFISDGSGATFQLALPLIKLEVTEFSLEPNVTSYVNITILNSKNSATYVNLTGITIIIEGEATRLTNTNPSLPKSLKPGESQRFRCIWRWARYQGKEVTVTVRTMQGYTAKYETVMPNYVNLEVMNATFNPSDTKGFNVTVKNAGSSVIPVRVVEVKLTLDNGTAYHVDMVTPSLPYELAINSTVNFRCIWDWTNYRGREITITIRTREGYIVEFKCTTPLK